MSVLAIVPPFNCVVPPSTSSVPPERVSPPLIVEADDTARVSARDIQRIARRDALHRFGRVDREDGLAPETLMTTSSFGPGTSPVLQLLATFQSPLVVEIQSTVARSRRDSATRPMADDSYPRLVPIDASSFGSSTSRH